MEIYKYDNSNCVSTHDNPMEDLLILWESFKNIEYVEEILQSKYGVTRKRRRQELSSKIKTYTSHGLELSRQAINSNVDSSFINLYYACLNLSKVLILFKGLDSQLSRNRWHGASYPNNMIRIQSPLNEYIEIKRNGSISLLYNCLTSQSISRNHRLHMRDIYPYIDDISAEYKQLYGLENKNIFGQITIQSESPTIHFLRIQDFHRETNLISSRRIKAINGMTISSISGKDYYVSPKVTGTIEYARLTLLNHLDRTIISDHDFSGRIFSSIPISAKQILFPQEMLIMLTFFYLSNVARYNPEHLNNLKNNKIWVVMYALKKHGFFKFLKSMYAHIMKESFCIYIK